MTEWWTYRLDSFLLFSARTYQRLLQSYNEELWPWQIAVLIAAVLALLWLARAHSPLRDRVLFAGLGLAWLAVAWLFLHQRFAAINWAADYAAALFAAEAAALWWVGVVRGGVAFRRQRAPSDPLALALLVLGLFVYPALGPMVGRPWSQAAVFGLMPEPTVIATLGLLLLADPVPRGLFAVPVLAALCGGAMLWALRIGEAWILPLGAALVVACLLWRRKRPWHRV